MSDTTEASGTSRGAAAVARTLLIGHDIAAINRHRVRALRDAAALDEVPGWCWIEAGPEGMIPDSSQTGVMGAHPVAGLVQDVHHDTQWLYAATSAGGIWRTASGPALAPIPVPPPTPPPTFAWQPVADELASLNVNTIAGVHRTAADGSPADVLVFGTGDASHTGHDGGAWFGLYRSVDGGRSFAPLDGGPAASRFLADDVNEIVALAPREWLVATRAGLWHSTNDGRTFDRLDEAHVQHVKIHFAALPADVRARATYSVRNEGLRRLDFPTAGGAPRRHRVGGDDWRWRPAGVSGTEPGDVAFDLERPTGATEWLVVSVGARDTSKKGAYHSLQYVLGALTGAGTTVPLNATGVSPAGRTPQTYYDHVVAVDPHWNDAGLGSLFWLGHIDLFNLRLPTSPTVAPSVVGGVHDDHHVIEPVGAPTKTFHGGPITPVLAGNDGGLVFSDDGGANWRALSAMRTTLFYGIDTAVTAAGHVAVVGGLQDNGCGFGTTEPGSGPPGPATDPDGPASFRWEQFSGGDGGTTLLLPVTAGVFDLAAFVWVNDRLERRARARVARTWATDGDLVRPAEDANFMGVLAKAQDAAGAWNTVYASLGTSKDGGARIFRCTTALASTLAAAGTAGAAFTAVPGAEWSKRITAMVAEPPATAGSPWRALWIGHIDGKVRYTPDALAATPTWEERTPPGNERPIGGMAVDPRDPRVLVLTTTRYAGAPSRYRTGRVWMRAPDASGNAVWTDISGRDDSDGTNLPDVPAYGVVITATSPRWIVIGTEIGVFATSDDGRTWRRMSLTMSRDGTQRRFGRLPQAAVYGVASPEAPTATAAATLPRIALGTYGRGAWVLQSLAAVGGAALAAVRVEADGAFGFVARAGTTTRAWSVTNLGAAPARITAATVTGPFALSGSARPPASASDPALTLAPGDRQVFELSCSPTAEGIATGALTLTTDLAHQPTIEVPLSCDAVADATPRLGSLPPDRLEFGPLPSSALPREERLVLVNVGTGPLTIAGIDVDGQAEPDGSDPPPHVWVTVHDVPTAPIPPGGTAVVRVRFDPRGAIWSAVERTLVIRSDDPSSPRRVTVEGGEDMPDWLKAVLVGAGVLLVFALGYGVAYALTKHR